MGYKSILAAIAVVLPPTVCFGLVWHVPDPVPTIQAALDSTGNGDTVLVEAGVYHEALQAPHHSFVLQGVIIPPDTLGPVIDPSPLAGSTHLACLTLPVGSQALVRDLVFRNGPAMFPRENSATGGIVNDALEFISEHCVFDSTSRGIYCGAGAQGTMTVTDCRFVLNTNGCIQDQGPGRITIENCDFSWNGDRALWLVDSALVENCRFPNVHSTGMEPIWLEGYGITIRGCIFGPGTAPVNCVIWTSGMLAFTFEQNTVEDIDVESSIIEFHGVVAGTESTRIQDNVFRRTRGVGPTQGGGGILIASQLENLATPPVVISNNVFDSCQAPTDQGYGALDMLAFNNWLDGNAFAGPSTPGPAIRKRQVDTLAVGNSSIHNCSFHYTGTALGADRWYLIAESNWWSDPTGPYHEHNPGGLGDTVIGRWVDYDPWLTEDPFLSAPEPRATVPSEARLEVYPNPFNSTATLALRVAQPGEYRVELFNLLGQQVAVLWKGQVDKERRVAIRTAGIGSGVYFARLSNIATQERIAMSKVVLLK